MAITVRLGPEYLPDPTKGKPISSGSVYVGTVDLDPEIVGNQIQLSVLQEDGNVVAVSQPVSTGAGGVPLYNGSPVTLLVDSAYSLKVLDSLGAQIYYVPSAGTLADDSVDTDQLVDGAVTTPKIADNAVTLAKMAPGVTGNMISYDAAGDPVAVATGIAKQHLKSNGPGLPPTFQYSDPQGINDVAASTDSNALTVEIKASTLDFRKADLTDGELDTISFSDLSLVVPDTATLGTVSTVLSELVIVALNNAGTVKIAIINISGGNDLTETGFITTVAMTTGADLDNVFYSDAIYTDVPYRVVGSIKSTQTTAGTWAQTLTVQGAGGTGIDVRNKQIIKGWISFNGTGTIAINDSFNVSSIVDNGTGNYTVNWDIDFANTNYAIIISIEATAGNDTNLNGVIANGGISAGSTQIFTGTATGTLTDVPGIFVIVIGEQ